MQFSCCLARLGIRTKPVSEDSWSDLTVNFSCFQDIGLTRCLLDELSRGGLRLIRYENALSVCSISVLHSLSPPGWSWERPNLYLSVWVPIMA